MQKERLTRGKALLATGAIFLAEACGGNAPVITPTPVRTPESSPSPVPTLNVTPTPSVEVTPSPVVTPSPTVEITPTPTPEATPTTLLGIITELVTDANGNYTNVSPEDVENKLDAVFSDPVLVDATYPSSTSTIKEGVFKQWTILKTGKGDLDPERNRQSAANAIIRSLFTGYEINQNADIYSGVESDGAIELILDFASNHMEPDTFNQLLEGFN